jgi:pimeloyl-ACP methyl ester carboxylesterase
VDHEISLGGETFHYRETGAEDAPPLVLLHAMGEQASDWDDFAAAVADRYRVLALTQRGHGRSPYSGGYSYARMRDDLLLFVDALGLATFTLIGHSLGGAVAIRFAQAHPDRLTRLVLEDVTALRTPREYPAEDRPDFDLPFDWDMLLAMRAEMATPDLTVVHRMADIAVPTLIIAGGPTSSIPQDQLAEAVERIPHARLATIDVGHFVHTEAPAEFLKEVNAFLAE